MTEHGDFHHDLVDHFGADHDDYSTGWNEAHPAATPSPSDEHLGVLHGDPAAAGAEWFLQQGNGYCVPASLTEVLSQITGHRFADESVVVERFAELGHPVTEHGETLDDAVDVLRTFGVESHVQTGATLTDLEQYLDQGRAIVIGVNADEIWYGANNPADNPTDSANHALLITGIDEQRGVVVLSDPGNPTGNQEVVPLDVFKDAWADGGNQLLVTDQPVEQPTQDGQPPAPGPVVVPMILNDNPPAGTSYTVQPGDTLWDIAERVYGDGSQYVRIASASGITNPNHILPGQGLTIPR